VSATVSVRSSIPGRSRVGGARGDAASVTAPRRTARAALSTLFALIAAAGAATARADFDPARMLREPEAIAQQFPDPDVRYPTPAFRDGRVDFPSHAEVLAYLDELARGSTRVRVETIGLSQQGRALPLAVLSSRGTPDTPPTTAARTAPRTKPAAAA